MSVHEDEIIKIAQEDFSLEEKPSNGDNKPPGKIRKKLKNLKFYLRRVYQDKIRMPVIIFKTGISNFWKWRKIIWEDRWWDYAFLLRMLHFKLKDMEKNWGTNTNYENDYNDKNILRDLIEDLEWMLDDEKEFLPNYIEEYKKRSMRFFTKLGRHHQKFWD